MDEKHILNWGAGVNSTAILALIHQGKLHYPNLKIIMCDTGVERPDTYCFINDMRKIIPDIIIINSPHGSLYDYCMETGHLPTGLVRWCTGEFKRKPIRNWAKANGYEDAKLIMGFASDESKRAKDDSVIYPLIELGITRKQCEEVIREVGWKVPGKSGCYICPFQRKKEWVAMQQNNPELFKKVVELEANSKYTYKQDKTISEWLADEKDQTRIVPYEDYQHCLCSLE